MAEAITPAAKHSKTYRKKKDAERAKLGIETLKVDVPAGVRQGLRKVMLLHGFSNVQEVWQSLALHLINASIEDQAKILHNDTSGFEVSPKLARQFRDASLAEIKREPGDEIIDPTDTNPASKR